MYARLYAPIVSFLLIAGLGTVIHCRLAVRGWGTFFRVTVVWGISAMLLLATFHKLPELHGLTNRSPLIVVLISVVAVTVTTEKAVRFSWFRANVKLRYQLGICCGLLLAASYIYEALSCTFIPNDNHVPRQFWEVQSACYGVVALLVPAVFLFIPSRYLLGYLLIGFLYLVTLAPTYPWFLHPSPTRLEIANHLLHRMAMHVTPFGLLGAALEFLPIPESSPQTNA